MKILYITPSLSFTFEKSKFSYLSNHGLKGNVLVGWGESETEETLNVKKSHEKNSGDFKYHVLFKTPGIIPYSLRKLWFYLKQGIRSHKETKFDVVVAYGTQLTGVAALMIKIFTKTKMVIEVPGNLSKALMFHETGVNRGMMNFLKIKIKEIIANTIIQYADRIHVLYPTQIAHNTPEKISVFHDFASLPRFDCTEVLDKKFILFMGYPWYLKGVDVLIKAFNRITDKYPDYSLKIVGECLNKEFFEKLTHGNKKIHLMDPVYHEEAMKLMSECSIFVLPSRTETMGRVLLEAMATKKPIVASNVDGIPYLIVDNVNGLLFEPENDIDLAEKISFLLTNKRESMKMAEQGNIDVLTHFSPERYTQLYTNMIHLSIKG